MSKKEFYSLSFSWGIVMTLIGLVAALALIVTGHKPKMYGYCIHFGIGKGWGGLNLGIVILSSEGALPVMLNHEHGHAIQNCKYGIGMVGISIASAVRYWYRNIRTSNGLPNKGAYDDIWFEAQATEWGNALMEGK